MIDFLVGRIAEFISAVGYFGVFFLMALESTMLPLPSELVMPFAGFLVAKGTFSFIGALIAATFGSLAGSLTSFYLGYYASRPFITRFGKYFFLNEYHLEKSEEWFKKRGKMTIFLGRFVPGVRHVISIPAGTGRMNVLSFSLFTLIGAGIWNAVLLYTGYLLQKNWNVVYSYTKTIDLVVITVITIAVIGYIVHLASKEKS